MFKLKCFRISSQIFAHYESDSSFKKLGWRQQKHREVNDFRLIGSKSGT